LFIQEIIRLPTSTLKISSIEVKVDISGDIVKAMRPSKNERFTTTTKFTEKVLQLCQANLEFLIEEVEIHYEAE
jgi:pantothenate kinase